MKIVNWAYISLLVGLRHKFSYSTIVSVDMASPEGEIQVYPNPNEGKSFYVKIPNTVYRNILVKIQSVEGKEIVSESIYATDNFEFFPLVTLTTGVYLVSVFDTHTTGNFSLRIE